MAGFPFSSFWKERRLNPTKGAAVLGKSLKRKKFGKNKLLGKKSYARRVIMQSLKSMRLAEVDNFFQTVLNKKKLTPL